MTDPFGTPVSSFLRMEDISGCTLLIRPLTIQKNIPSTLKGQEGKTYDSVWSDVVVLAGSPNSEKIPELPYVIERMKLSGAALVPSVTGRFRVVTQTLGGKTGEFDLQPKDPAIPYVLGVLTTLKSAYGTPQWTLSDPTEDGISKARQWVKDNPLKEQDPFA